MVINGVNGFWKERRAINRDEGSDWMTMKDDDGRRVVDPEKNKEIIANYYEKLYSEGNVPYHPHHELVSERVTVLSNERTINEELDTMPTKEEIREVKSISISG